MTTQLGLFEEAGVEVKEPEPKTPVRAGNKTVQNPLRKKRRKALEKLMEVLDRLEGKDVYIGTCGGSGSHFWLNHLKLGRMKVEKGSFGGDMPSVIALWGSRGASIRIFTDQVVNLRQQEYQGCTWWLLDFWNGFGEYPINPYRPRGSVSLHIVRFKD